MQKVSLKKEYISVDGSFGGNQRWLRKDADKANTLSDYGCGLISANDVLLHISDKANSTSKEKYIAAICKMNRRYFHVLPFLGVSGIMLSFYMRIYLFMHRKHFGKRYKVRWGVLPKRQFACIKEMLENDIPVVLSIGPGLIRGRKKELPLYSLNESENSGTNKTYDIKGRDAINDNIDFTQVNSVKDHYVNVTGIIETENSTMLEISSWGKRYYIDYNEYRDFVRKHDNYLFSNILYIKIKQKM